MRHRERILEMMEKRATRRTTYEHERSLSSNWIRMVLDLADVPMHYRADMASRLDQWELAQVRYQRAKSGDFTFRSSSFRVMVQKVKGWVTEAESKDPRATS